MPELSKHRPKFLNLMEIRLPIAGIASILHRVSGAGLFLMLPLLVYLLQLSLGTPQEFDAFRGIVGHPLVKLFLIGLLWAFLHHFCMGIRVLLLDLHVGIDKASAALSAKIVLAVSIALTLVLGAKLW
jgi:succinate dehydrogenase / fumarate reductase cytochrome b subunit